MRKKMSLLLGLTMIMSLLPMQLSVKVKAETTPSVTLGGTSQITTGAAIYFGKHTKEDGNEAPILWRVMGVEGEKVTLLSDKILEYRQYNGSWDHKNWSESDICKYLNSKDTYADTGFLTTAFTPQEQGYIETYSTVREQVKGSSYTIIPDQKIVLPSFDEVTTGGAYGFNDNDSRKAYDAEGYNNKWWLRSPVIWSTVISVEANGDIMNPINGSTDVDVNLGVRPALKLNLSSVLFTSDAQGSGKKSTTANSQLASVASSTNNQKLTCIDRSGQRVSIGKTAFNYIKGQETEIEISYSDATTGTNQYLSAMITDKNGVLKYYGVIKDLSASSSPSGTAKVTIPSDFDSNKYDLKIFTEQIKSECLTDYASEPVELKLTEYEYSITYYLDGGTQEANAPSGYNYGQEITLPTPTKEGYNFRGWYTDKDFTQGPVSAIGAKDTGNKVYWAKWTIPEAPVITTTSLPNGTVGASYSQTLTATGDTPITWSVSGTLPVGLSLNSSTGEISGTPTAAGKASFTIKASNGVDPAATRALSITVDAVPVIAYTVSFNSNGGNTISSITDIPLNKTITLPTPIRANYRFEGWYEGNVQYTSSTPITKSVTLVAKWSYIGTSSGGNSGSNSGGNSGGSTTSTAQKTTKERIASLSSSQKQAVANYFKEELPYTTMNPSFAEQALKGLTDKQFTDAQVKEILGDKALLKELGIESHIAISLIDLKPIAHATFTDVATNHWAYEAIKEAAALGLVAGMPDGSFAPNSPLQVADTFTFLDRVLILNNINGMKLPRSTVEKYLTNKEHWAFASMASIASKLSEATLKTISELGDKPLSRELLTQVLYEVTDGKLEPIKESIAFEDTANSPYKEAIDYCVRAGLISGVNRTHMAPTKSVTRAELMIVLVRLDNALK